MKSLKEIRDGLNNVEILPRAAVGFSTRNRKTGEESGVKSVKISFSVTLWHLILGALAALALLQTLSALRGALRESRIRREVKRELLKKRKDEA